MFTCQKAKSDEKQSPHPFSSRENLGKPTDSLRQLKGKEWKYRFNLGTIRLSYRFPKGMQKERGQLD